METEQSEAPEATRTALCIKCGDPNSCADMERLTSTCGEPLWVHEDCLSEHWRDQEAYQAEHGGEVLVRMEVSANEYRELGEKAAKAGLSIEEYVAKRARERGLLGKIQQ